MKSHMYKNGYPAMTQVDWVKKLTNSVFPSGILQFLMVVTLSLSLYLQLSRTEAPFLQSRASNKIMSVHVVDKNGMRAVDEKQVISL